MVRIINVEPEDEDNKAFLRDSIGDRPVVSAFYMPGCGYCDMLRGPWHEFENMVRKKYPDDHTVIAFVHKDAEGDIRSAMKEPLLIQGYPTIMGFRKDGGREEFRGERSADSLLRFYETVVGSNKTTKHKKTKKHKKKGKKGFGGEGSDGSKSSKSSKGSKKRNNQITGTTMNDMSTAMNSVDLEEKEAKINRGNRGNQDKKSSVSPMKIGNYTGEVTSPYGQTVYKNSLGFGGPRPRPRPRPRSPSYPAPPPLPLDDTSGESVTSSEPPKKKSKKSKKTKKSKGGRRTKRYRRASRKVSSK